MSLITRLATRISTRSIAPINRLTTIAHASASAQADPEPATAPSPSTRPHHVVMSIAGQDRTGIVNTFTSCVAQHEANIEESKMAILGGDFAMIVYVSMAKPTDGETLAANVRAQLPEFSVTLRSTTPPEQKTAVGLWRLLLEGPDQPGIVSAVSECLARHGGNVHEMDTETTTAPFAGYTLFRISGKVALEDATLDKVYVALNQVEERFGASIMLNQIADK